MTVASDLVALGWRNGSTQSIRDFQRIYGLEGAPLTADGIAGPKTRAALAVSMARRAKGLPDISANFSAREFACNCGGKYADCRRIWTPRAVVRGLEAMRTKFGPFSPDRAGRCPGENARVGGAPKSLHLSGWAIDLPVFKFTLSQWRAMGLWSGLGYYDYGSGRVYVRHCDMRHLAGHLSTPGSPATWPYPNPQQHTPRDLRPVTTTTPTPAPVPKPTTRWTRDHVRAMQGYLELKVDGSWGPATDTKAHAFRAVAYSGMPHTTAHVKVVQSIIDVRVDGSLGPKTRAALKANVVYWQRLLKVTADGNWGPGTDRAFQAFRAEWRGK